VSASFTFTELTELAADLGDVPAKALRNVRKSVEVGARGIKDDWRAVATADSGRHARLYPRAITYDMDGLTVFGVDVVRAEIGPEIGRRQGRLGFLEEGVPGQNTAGQHGMRLAVKANEDDFMRGLLTAISDPLEQP
jgi:hypothetical protein